MMTNCETRYSQILQDPRRIAEFVRQKIDNKVRWYQQNRHQYECSTWPNWQDQVLDVFYKGNLSIEVPRDGELVCKTGNALIIDWRSPCPILESCEQNGDDTIQVCSTLYHVQYQVLLSLIHPGLLFTRDYSQLRPSVDHCREVILYRPATVEARQALRFGILQNPET